MPSPKPRRTRAVLASPSSCAMAAFRVEAGSAFAIISGLAQCSFALRPARSLTPFKGAFFIEDSGRLVASSSAPIATGWSEIFRVGLYLSHWSPVPFSRRTWIGMHPTHENLVAECQQCGANKHSEDALGCHATQCADQYHRHRRLDTASQQ